jgi:putative ABC transport system permease protein
MSIRSTLVMRASVNLNRSSGGLLRDIRHAARALRRAPAFTAIAVAVLALGIASATAAFSVLDTVVLRGMPYRDADQLRTIYEHSDDGKARTPSYPTFQDWQAQTMQGATAGAIDGFAFVRGDGVSLAGDEDEDRKIAAYVSPGFFRLMGSAPLLGRTFSPEEEARGARVAMLSYGLFVDRFGAQRSVVGRVIDVDSIPTTIIGVMPPHFAYPNFGGDSWFPPALWEPIAAFAATHPEVLQRRGLHVDSRTIVRLHSGIDSARAVIVMQTIERRLGAVYPVDQAHWTSVDLQSMADELFGGVQRSLALVAGAVGLVMLLACANVATLFLIRAGGRARDTAVRSALGASRWRLVRQPVCETLLVAIAAGGLGLALAVALVAFTRHRLGYLLPFAARLGVDGRAVAFTGAASMVTALIVGSAPALHVRAVQAMHLIRSGTTGAVGGRRERRARDLLVVLQFALALSLLLGAGLLLQSFRRLVDVPLGYDPNGVISFAIAPTTHAYDTPAAAAALYARILDAERAVPGVEAAAAAGGALLPTPVSFDGAPTSGQPLLQALYHPVSADYRRAMRIRLVAGRWFTDADMRAPMDGGLVVSQTLARQLGGSPIGRRITIQRQSQARADFGQPITLPVIGIVGDVHEYGPAQDTGGEVYLPYTLEVWPWMTFDVRATDAERAQRVVEKTVREVEPAIRFMSRPSVTGGGAAQIGPQRRFLTTVVTGFAGLALLLAAIGLYGIAAYGVAQRTREIGVRMALGATEARAVWLVVREAIGLVAAGAVGGALLAAAFARVMRAMLFETTTTDPAALGVAAVVLAAVAIVAVYGPARRAARIDPVIAIRAD